MPEKRNFIILSHTKTSDALTITGIAERYNAQLKWQAVRYASERDWIIEIPKQPQSTEEVEDAYELVFEGWTPFREELQKCLDSFQWQVVRNLPFETSS